MMLLNKPLRWLLPVIILVSLLLPALHNPVVWAQGGQVVITVEANLNVRSLPTVDSPSLQVAPAGTSMLAVGRSANSNWIQVEYKGVVGWVSAFYITSSTSLSVLPVTDGTDPAIVNRPQERQSAPDGTLVNTGELVVFAAYSEVNVRALPSETAPILGQLQPNERATVTLLDPTRQWGQIIFQGQVGWVALYVVNVLGDIRTVAVSGDPGSGSNLPVPQSQTLTLEQREIVDRVQAHLGRYFAPASTLIDILNSGATSGIMSCGIPITLFREFRITRLELTRLPEISPIVDNMNAGLDKVGQARARWLSACESGNMRQFQGQFFTWLSLGQEGLALLQQAQLDLALLSAR